jgi:anti-sigma factor RsiW
MNCDEMRERIPDVAAGLSKMNPGESQHVATCAACAGTLAEFRQTMALLDEWKAPEPSRYFDTRMQARLREEMAKPQAGWLQWFRRPVLAASLTLLLGLGVGMFFVRGWEGTGPGNSVSDKVAMAAPGTAVSDLQALDSNHDEYSDFELLDDLQPDVNQ